jgi:hypothetical protein
MKAKESQEKIYIQPNAHDGWFETNNPTESLVEYTRTDAFIEKACKWLEEQEEITSLIFQEDFINRFKKYMKGE